MLSLNLYSRAVIACDLLLSLQISLFSVGTQIFWVTVSQWATSIYRAVGLISKRASIKSWQFYLEPAVIVSLLWVVSQQFFNGATIFSFCHCLLSRVSIGASCVSCLVLGDTS